jgi:hypothetical protein
MKKLLFSLTALVCSTALFAQTPATNQKKAADVAKFEMETNDLGKIKQDNPATATFIVTNISQEPLLIEQANPTCGCTISDYTKEPIAPGKTGTIKATYNAKNVGPFDKHLTVKFAGVDEVKSITIKGEVLNPEEYAKLHPGAGTDAVVKPVTSTSEVKTTTTTTTTPAKTAGKRTTSKKSSTTTTTKVAPAAAPKS